MRNRYSVYNVNQANTVHDAIMGSIWEKIRSGARKSTNRTSNGVPLISNGVRAQEDTAMRVKDDVKISRILEYLRKLAVDSAVDDSLKGVAGGVLVDKIVKEDQKNNEIGLKVAEVVCANIEKMQENANCFDPQTTISTQSIQLLDCFEDFPEESIRGSNSSKTAPKRIMIRSRL